LKYGEWKERGAQKEKEGGLCEGGSRRGIVRLAYKKEDSVRLGLCANNSFYNSGKEWLQDSPWEYSEKEGKGFPAVRRDL